MKKPDSINGLIKQLFPLPASLVLTGAAQEHRRARSLTVMLLTISFTVWFWNIVLCLIYFFTKADILFNIYYAFFVSSALGLQVWGFYRYANLRMASMLFTLTFFLMALSLVLMSGGFNSPNLVVLLSSPVISFRAGGKDEGIMNSVFVGLAGLALVVTDILGVPMMNLLAGLHEGFFFAIAWVVTLTVIAATMVTYDLDE